MCTATWLRTDDGYELFFNRDELVTRKPALPPSVRERDGVRFLAPVDGDAGGTWLGVNEHGLTVGLANGPRGERDRGPGPFRSRGLLVLDLLASRDLSGTQVRMQALHTKELRSFELFAIEPRGEISLWRFDGERLEARPGGAEGALLFSSSKDAERARRERRALLERMVRDAGGLDAGVLAAFHASHEPERGAFSPCMHRDDARTVSVSRIRVGEREIEFEYRPGPPCEGASTVTRTLLRSGPRGSGRL